MSHLLSPGSYHAAVHVLGIEVETSLVRRWAGWLAPACQPFFLAVAEAAELGLTPENPAHDLSPELRDTYEVWNLAKDLEAVWLDEDAFHAQPRDVRARLVRTQARHGRGAVPTISDWADILDAQVLREQADGHRFVWWPTLVAPHLEAVLQRVLGEWQLPCQRKSVPEEIWRAASSILPNARALSGTAPGPTHSHPTKPSGRVACAPPGHHLDLPLSRSGCSDWRRHRRRLHLRTAHRAGPRLRPRPTLPLMARGWPSPSEAFFSTIRWRFRTQLRARPV